MSLSRVISLGLGAPSSVEHFLTLGLEAGAPVLLTGGATGYVYAPTTEVEPALETVPPASVPSLTTGPSGSEPTYTYSA